MLKTILQRQIWGLIISAAVLSTTNLPVMADDKTLDLTAFSIDKITPFGIKKPNGPLTPTLVQPVVHLKAGDVLLVKLSKTQGRSPYGPCQLESSVDSVLNKSIIELDHGQYMAIKAGEAAVVVFPLGTALGDRLDAIRIPIQVTAPSSLEEEESVLNSTPPPSDTAKVSMPQGVIERIESEISSNAFNIYKIVDKNRIALLNSYMFVLAKRTGKACLPFLAGLDHAEEEAKTEVQKFIKMLTNSDYEKSPEKSTQSWQAWWQIHATDYGVDPRETHL